MGPNLGQETIPGNIVNEILPMVFESLKKKIRIITTTTIIIKTCETNGNLEFFSKNHGLWCGISYTLRTG